MEPIPSTLPEEVRPKDKKNEDTLHKVDRCWRTFYMVLMIWFLCDNILYYNDVVVYSILAVGYQYVVQAAEKTLSLLFAKVPSFSLQRPSVSFYLPSRKVILRWCCNALIASIAIILLAFFTLISFYHLFRERVWTALLVIRHIPTILFLKRASRLKKLWFGARVSSWILNLIFPAVLWWYYSKSEQTYFQGVITLTFPIMVVCFYVLFRFLTAFYDLKNYLAIFKIEKLPMFVRTFKSTFSYF